MCGMHAPYKGRYTVAEFWGELTQASWYAKYAAANPKEAAALAEYADNKMHATGTWTTPGDITNSHLGDAILMALMTLPTQ